jgi:hypothetical protein
MTAVVISFVSAAFGAAVGAIAALFVQRRIERDRLTVEILREIRSSGFIEKRDFFFALTVEAGQRFGRVDSKAVDLLLSEKDHRKYALMYASFEEYIIGICGLIETGSINPRIMKSFSGEVFHVIKGMLETIYQQDPLENSWKLRKLQFLGHAAKAEQLEPTFNGWRRLFPR